MSDLVDLAPDDLKHLLESEPVLLVDVREVDEYARRHIKGSLLMPMSVFDPEDFPSIKGAKIVLFCAAGKRSAAAAKMLKASGYGGPLYQLTGGVAAWADAGLPTVDAPQDYEI